jgi:phospholipid/cholesterol/gamma-HCH transport system substrate-binding protein
MSQRTVEITVGIFVLIGIVCVGYLTIKLGKMEIIGGNYYLLSARFQSVSGLKNGSQVEMAGVQIGNVDRIYLDPERQVAVVDMNIRNGIELSQDVIASIKTSGLIGDKYVKLTPGIAEDMLQPGEMITQTESAIDIEELISKYVFGGV